MLLIAGAIVVTLSVAGGFLLAGGKLAVLVQPSEFVIIGGAAVGSLLIGTPIPVLKQIVSQFKGILGRETDKKGYVELLTMLFQLFKLSQQGGIMALESHFETPATSTILSKFPRFLARRGALDFLSDSVKVMIVGGISPHDLDTLMDEDLEVRRHEAGRGGAALAKIADALPGLGIVAAVLGVINTMGSIDGPPAEIGLKVGEALVGTFLGVLLSYGFTQPLASSLEQRAIGDVHYEVCIKAGLAAVYKGMPPAIAIEFARRALPEEVRPSFEETEAFCRAPKADAANAEAPKGEAKAA